ncbi:MAG TPA: pseudouridine synthase [Nitrospiria bacterium]|nr:pseudouridine synthase [Nitrospiria bacterium]
MERLQKIISAAGVASRRKAEEMILEGSVTVNGKVIVELGAKADAEKDHIKVNGKLINPVQPRVVLLLNKPKSYISSLNDPEGRPTVLSLLKGYKGRVYPIGRLDYDTEGLLLLTNDGELAHRLMHPSSRIVKTYEVKVKGVLKDEEIKKLSEGVEILGKKTAPASVKKVAKTDENSWIEMKIHEGRNQQIKRMLFKLRHPVLKIKRKAYAFLTLEGVLPGKFRYLRIDEIKKLKALIPAEKAKPAKVRRVANG